MNSVRSGRFLRLTDALYLLSYLLCMTDAMLISYTTLNGSAAAHYASLFLRGASLLGMMAKLILDRKHKASTLLFILLFCGLMGFALLRSAYNHLFYLMVAGMGVWNVNLRQAVWADFGAKLALTLLIIGGALAGAIDHYVTYRTGSTALRYSLGFNHPNTLASVVFSLTLEEAWLTRRRPGLLYAGIILLMTVPLYLLTLNRTALLLSLLFPFLLPWAFRARPLGKASLIFWVLFPALIILLSIAAMYLCQGSAAFRQFDLLMSNRFFNSLRVYRQYGIPLLGQRVQLVSVRTARLENESPVLLDVAYLRTLLQAGPVILLFCGALYAAALGKACREQDRYSILIFALFILFGLFESGFNNPFLNFTQLIAMRSLGGLRKNAAAPP